MGELADILGNKDKPASATAAAQEQEKAEAACSSQASSGEDEGANAQEDIGMNAVFAPLIPLKFNKKCVSAQKISFYYN